MILLVPATVRQSDRLTARVKEIHIEELIEM
jgi:hypothetical protein